MIRVQKLSKYFSSKRALGPVSFEIGDGETVGFLGLNGAGKTTALRILACDLRPSSGTVQVENVDAISNPHEVRKRVGFLPETTPLHLDMVVTDYIRFAGRLRGMSKADVNKRIGAVIDVTNLEDVQDELILHLSHGYRQRVGVAQAIIHEPKLLILDEPTRGLDPVQIVDMRAMIQRLKEGKQTVLISSHILTEISQTCDRVLVLGNGRLIASGDEDSLSAELLDTKSLVVSVREPTGTGHPYRNDDDTDASEDNGEDAAASSNAEASAAVKALLDSVEGVTSVEEVPSEKGAMAFQLGCDDDVRSAVCKALVEAGHDVIKLDRSNTELESIFLNLVHQGGEDASN